MEKGILVTGATGFLGRHFLLSELLERRGPIACIARNTLREEAEERVWKALETAATHAGLGARVPLLRREFAERVRIVRGDIEKELCGLEGDALRAFEITEVWHFAAILRFSLRLREHVERSIVEGTSNVLDLCRERGARVFNYLSSAIAAGNETGRLTETLYTRAETADTSYEIAKRMAEELVTRSCDAWGLPYRIFRPSIVMGHSETGEGQTDTGLYGLVTICAKLKNEIESKIPGFLKRHPLRILQPDEDAETNMIPVDEAVAQMRAIAEKRESTGQIFHIVSRRQLRLGTFLDELESALDVRVERVADVDQFEPLDHLVRKQMGEYEKYFRNSYLFDTRNADRFLDTAALQSGNWDSSEVRFLIERYYARFADEDSRARLFQSPLDSFEEKTTRSSVGPLTYYVGGEGAERILILNAYGQSVHFWTELFNLLRPEYRVYLWEMRGTSVLDGGVSEHFRVENHVQDGLHILEAEDLRRCHLIGWCTGGKLALEIASRVPDRVASITCLTPSFKGVKGESMDTKYEENMESICRLVDADPNNTRMVQRFIGDILGGNGAASDDPINANVNTVLSMVNRTVRPLLLAPFVAERSILNYARQLLDFWSQDISDLYGRVEQPIMLLTGERDEIASAPLARKVIARFPNAVGFQVLNGSHYIQKENYADIKGVLDGFFESGTGVLPKTNRLERLL